MKTEDYSPREGESVQAYIARMHGGRGCTCPRAYSRCKFAVAFDRRTGDRSRGHGGWGWGS